MNWCAPLLRAFNCRISIYLLVISEPYSMFYSPFFCCCLRQMATRRVAHFSVQHQRSTTVGRLRLFVAFSSRAQQLHGLSAEGEGVGLMGRWAWQADAPI